MAIGYIELDDWIPFRKMFAYMDASDLCLSIRNCIKRAPKSTVPGQHRFGF